MAGGLLLACTDPERLIADLAFRYTASDGSFEGGSKQDRDARTALMTAVLACFEALVAAERTAELSNAIVWILLGAAEDGTFDALRMASAQHRTQADLDNVSRLDSQLDARTGHCLRFLASLVAGREYATGAARHAMLTNLCKAARINLQLEHGLNVDETHIACWLGLTGM